MKSLISTDSLHSSTLLYLPLQDGGVLPSHRDEPALVCQEGEAGDCRAVASVLVVAALGLTGRVGEQPQLATVRPGHQQAALLAAGGRGEVRLGGVSPETQGGPGEEAVGGGPGDVAADLGVGDDPAEGGGDHHHLPVQAVGLQVLAVQAPVQAGQQGGQSWCNCLLLLETDNEIKTSFPDLIGVLPPCSVPPPFLDQS